MTNVPLGAGAYKRGFANEPEIKLQNRYFEANPTDSEGNAALLARPGTTLLSSFGDGPIRRCFTKPGLFDGDLFVTSGPQLFRYNGTTTTPITGTLEGSGAPTFAWMKGIGYEYLFLADGLLLQSYAGGSHATGTLTSDTYDYVWTSRTSSENNHWRSVCWAPALTLFVAVSSEDSGDPDTHLVMTSPDGVTWTNRTDAAAGHGWRGVCWSEDLALLVAVGTPDSGDAVMTSPDGTTWTARTTTTVATGTYRAVCWSPELALFVAVGDAGLLMTSPDGVTWTDRTPAVFNDWRAVCWSPDLLLFCATASTGIGNRVMTSPDGINWETQTSPADAEWCGVVWAASLGLFCAITAGSAMTSPDGVTWTLTHIAGADGLFAICWSPDLRLFTAVGDGVVYTSSRGTAWTARAPAAANYWQGVCWSSDLSLFAAVSINGSANRVMTSDANATPVIAGQVIEIGGAYYSWDTDVDNGTPDGTATSPWLALLGADDIVSMQAMANLLGFAGTPGVDFSTTLTGPNDDVTATADLFSLTLTSVGTDSTSNAITITVYMGSDLSWGAATLTGGDVHALTPVAVPDYQKALALASLAGFVLVSIAGTQKVYYILPGETTIDALSFFEKESAPDNIVDMQTVGDTVLIMGNGSTEAWYATGDGIAPFAPTQGRVYERGVLSGTPVVLGDNQMAFLGNDLKGYLLVGGQVERISNHGLEERIRRWFRAAEGLTP